METFILYIVPFFIYFLVSLFEKKTNNSSILSFNGAIFVPVWLGISLSSWLNIPFASNYFLIFIGISTYFIRRRFINSSLLDNPDGMLKKHDNPVPFSGGATIALLLVIYTVIVGFNKAYCLGFSTLVKLLFLPIFYVLPINLYDDIYRISVSKRALSQLVFATLVVLTFCLQNGIVSQIVSFIFVLSLLNAIDLVDVADGLCTTLSISAFFGLMMIFPIIQIKAFSMVIIPILFGIFVFNSPNALLYLGNSGSALLGSIFSVLILNYIDLGNLKTFVTLTTIFGVFFAEILGLIIVRSLLGIKPYKGSPHHFNSFLRSKEYGNWGKWRVLSFVASISMILNIIAWLFFNDLIDLKLYFIIIGLALWMWITVIYWPFLSNLKVLSRDHYGSGSS